MGLRIQFLFSTGLAGILLILVIANIWFYQSNIDRQREIDNRQALIQQATQLDGLNREILEALVSLSVNQGDKPGDKQIEQMLATLGLKVNIGPAQPSPAPAAAKPK